MYPLLVYDVTEMGRVPTSDLDRLRTLLQRFSSSWPPRWGSDTPSRPQPLYTTNRTANCAKAGYRPTPTAKRPYTWDGANTSKSLLSRAGVFFGFRSCCSNFHPSNSAHKTELQGTRPKSPHSRLVFFSLLTSSKAKLYGTT